MKNFFVRERIQIIFIADLHCVCGSYGAIQLRAEDGDELDGTSNSCERDDAARPENPTCSILMADSFHPVHANTWCVGGCGLDLKMLNV